MTRNSRTGRGTNCWRYAGEAIVSVLMVHEGVETGQEGVEINGGEWEFTATLDASEREREMLSAGGKLAWTKQQAEGGSGVAPADD